MSPGVLLLGAVCMAGPAKGRHKHVTVSAPAARITIDYPAAGAVFPPEITPPVFLWRDEDDTAKLWIIDVSFGDRSRGIQARSRGEKRPIGEIDERCAKAGAVAPQLAPNELAGHSWTPDAETWATIKKHSVKRSTTPSPSPDSATMRRPSRFRAARSPFKPRGIRWALPFSSATSR